MSNNVSTRQFGAHNQLLPQQGQMHYQSRIWMHQQFQRNPFCDEYVDQNLAVWDSEDLDHVPENGLGVPNQYPPSERSCPLRMFWLFRIHRLNGLETRVLKGPYCDFLLWAVDESKEVLGYQHQVIVLENEHQLVDLAPSHSAA